MSRKTIVWVLAALAVMATLVPLLTVVLSDSPPPSPDGPPAFVGR